MSNPIETAVAPLKADAIARAELEANKLVDRVRTELAAADNLIKKVAPYPDTCYGSLVFHNELRKYYLFSALTKWRPHRVGEPTCADVDEGRVAAFIKEAKADAALQYDAFVAKLIGKIGEVTEAALTGNHVWSYSHLRVTTAAGEKQVWKTQQIVNCSKLGRLYNQWPTRKIKA